MCTDDRCPDYYNDPKPGDLWPGETDEEFGYPCSTNATKEVTSAGAAKAARKVDDDEQIGL